MLKGLSNADDQERRLRQIQPRIAYKSRVLFPSEEPTIRQLLACVTDVTSRTSKSVETKPPGAKGTNLHDMEFLPWQQNLQSWPPNISACQRNINNTAWNTKLSLSRRMQPDTIL